MEFFCAIDGGLGGSLGKTTNNTNEKKAKPLVTPAYLQKNNKTATTDVITLKIIVSKYSPFSISSWVPADTTRVGIKNESDDPS